MLRGPRMAIIQQKSRFGLLEFLFGASSPLTSRLLTWSETHPGLMYSVSKTRCSTTPCSSDGSGSSTVAAPVAMATGREAGSEA